MRLLKYLAMSIVFLILLFIGVGFVLPSNFSVSRAIEINADAPSIFAHISDFQEWPKWGVWFKRDSEMALAYDGQPGNVGHTVSWKSTTQGNGKMVLRKITPNQSIEYDLIFPDMGMQSVGRMTLERQSGKTRVSWTDEGDVGSDLVGRYFLLVIDDMLGPEFEAGLSNLKSLAEHAE